MGKIGLIIKREYLVRVRKKSFIIMTLLGPLLFALALVVPAALIVMSSLEERRLLVVDQSGLLEGKLKDTETFKYSYTRTEPADVKQGLGGGDYTGVLYIPANLDPQKPTGISLVSNKALGIEAQSSLERRIQGVLQDKLLADRGISKEEIEALEPDVTIQTRVLSEEGSEEESSTGASTAIGYVSSLLIYLFVFMYGAQVLRGVIEEKTNRIVEVLISSVKPFELMMGKIIGIALVGLTQFLLWIMLSAAVSTALSAAATAFLGPELAARTQKSMPMRSPQIMQQGQHEQAEEQASASTGRSKGKEEAAEFITDFKGALATIDFVKIAACFLFYFLGGYLLYSSLFAAVGAAVDSETDSQQFMAPITIPLIGAFIMGQGVVQNPDSSLAFWMSMIPLTSPVIMMLRLPFHVPAWQLLLSMGLLVVTFVFCVWLASRIYRVGILMYGKKPTYKELGKWLFYKT